MIESLKINPTDFIKFLRSLLKVNSIVWFEYRDKLIRASYVGKDFSGVFKSSNFTVNSTPSKEVTFGADVTKLIKILNNFTADAEVTILFECSELSSYAKQFTIINNSKKIKFIYPACEPKAFSEKFISDDRIIYLRDKIKFDFSFTITKQDIKFIHKNLDLSAKEYVEVETSEEGVFIRDADKYLNIKIDDKKYSEVHKVYFAKNAFEYLDEDTDYTVNCGEVKTVMESVLNKDNVIFLSHYIVIDDVFETLKDVKN